MGDGHEVDRATFSITACPACGTDCIEAVAANTGVPVLVELGRHTDGDGCLIDHVRPPVFARSLRRGRFGAVRRLHNKARCADALGQARAARAAGATTQREERS